MAEDTTEHFHGDLHPLVDRLFTVDNDTAAEYPSRSDYLGYLSLGTEAYSSSTEVTFHVPELSIDIETQKSSKF